MNAIKTKRHPEVIVAPTVSHSRPSVQGLIPVALARFGVRSAEVAHREEFLRAMHGLGQLAMATQQVRVPGLVNHIAESVYGLSRLVEAARAHLDTPASATALATWALAVAYAMRHLGAGAMGPRHPQWRNSLDRIGRDAPFDAAHEVIDSVAFNHRWANKMPFLPPEFDFDATPPTVVAPGGVKAVHDFLDLAESEA